jgi:hypothetical protein
VVDALIFGDWQVILKLGQECRKWCQFLFQALISNTVHVVTGAVVSRKQQEETTWTVLHIDSYALLGTSVQHQAARGHQQPEQCVEASTKV